MNNPLDLLLPVESTPPDRHVFGTVTSVAPLRVRLDGDSVSLPMSPTTVADVRQDDRVLVLVKGLQRIVLGRVTSSGLPIGQAFEVAGTGVLTVAPGNAVSGLAQTLTVTIGHEYRVDVHLDAQLPASTLAVFRLFTGGSPRAGELVASIQGRQPLTRTWIVKATSASGPLTFEVVNTASASGTTTIYGASSILRVTRTS